MIYETIFKKLDKLGVIELIKDKKEAAKAQSSGFMDLGFDRLVNDPSGAAIIALHHYYVQMGDMMADPDMQIRVFLDTAMSEAMTFQQDSLGIYQEVYPEPDKVNLKLKGQLNRFLSSWLNNLLNQGFSFKDTCPECGASLKDNVSIGHRDGVIRSSCKSCGKILASEGDN